MSRLVKIFALLVSLVIVPTAVAAATKVAGTWERIPSAPSGTLPAATVWTGRQLIVLGRRVGSGALAQAYDPTAKAWKRLTPPAKLGSDPYCCSAVWTGKQLLAWGAFAAAAYDPATNSWRTLSRSIQGGILVWTGREAIGWGGGCCGDARSNGRTYNPATKTFRVLPRSPLAPDQGPVGAWTGRELLLFVHGLTPDGKPYPASFARAAAYDPATNRWRRIAVMPSHGGTAVWDGRELLVVGAGTRARATLAFDPATNRWRRLASSPASAAGSVVWTGKRVLLWAASRGFSYDPSTNRWAALPSWPLRPREGSAIAWTGRSLIVWGGEIGTPLGTSIPPKFPLDGASFTPAVK